MRWTLHVHMNPACASAALEVDSRCLMQAVSSMAATRGSATEASAFFLLLNPMLQNSPKDNQGFISPELAQRMFNLSRDEIDQFASAITSNKSAGLRSDCTFKLEFAIATANQIRGER